MGPRETLFSVADSLCAYFDRWSGDIGVGGCDLKGTLVFQCWNDEIGLTYQLFQGKDLGASKISTSSDSSSYSLGLFVLLVAQILSSFMGVYVQDVYAEHGKHWDENLFYSHFLSLPMFLPLHGQLRTQYVRLEQSPQMTLSPSLTPYIPSTILDLINLIPRSVYMLFLNSITQLACITGVNLLGANSSAVTVTIVLNVRKLVSWMLSIWLFGNKLSNLMIIGAVLVFGAGALYGWETNVGIKRRQKRDEKRVEAASGTTQVHKKGGEKKEL